MDGIAVKYAVGYHGTPLHYVNDQTALAICGNSICSYSLVGGPSAHLFWGQGCGISTSAYHPKTNRIAYAEKGLRPAVYIHDLTTNKLFAKLSGVADLEVTSLAFSMEGSRLFTAAREPDFRLVLWDLTSEEPSKLAEGISGWLVRYANFSPTTADHICISGFGKFALWTFDQTFHRTFFSCRTLQAGPFKPHCHSWTETGDFIYIGGLKGEVLVVNTRMFLELDVVDGEPNQLSLQEVLEEDTDTSYSEETCNKHNWESHPEWTVLLRIQTIGIITCVFVGEKHIVIIGGGGILKWFFVFDLNQSVNKNFSLGKKVSEGGSIDDKETSFPDECSSAIPHKEYLNGIETILLSELDLIQPDIVTAQYTAITGKLLLGSRHNSITVVRVDLQTLQFLIHELSAITSSQLQQSCQIEWQSSFHSGPIFGLTSLGAGKFIVTCGQDCTVRVWDADQGRELSCQCFKAAQTCVDSNEENNMVINGSISGDIHKMKLDSAGRLAIIFQAKLHPGSLEKISFNPAGSNIVAVSKLDGKLFFLKTGASDMDELDLLGYALLKDSILDIAWDVPNSHGSAGFDDMFILVSLARGEIVKLKVPTTKASGGGLFFENKVLRRISFCIAVPLLAIVVGKYYLEKEGVERKVIWGLGQDKKLHQYRLPDSLQAWTGSDGMPLLAHFHIPAHSKPGCAIVLCEKTSVLLTGAEDGVLQLRKMVLDPLHAPVKVRDIQMYDGYNGGITCVTVAGRRIFTAGANGVLFSCPAMEAAVLEDDLRHGTSFFPTKDSFVVDRTKHYTKTENEESHTLSILEKYEENAEARSSLAIQACQTQMRNQIQKIRAEFVELFEKNRKAPDLEQLSSLELIVDLELEAQLRMDGQKRIHHARQQVRLENVKKEILAERIKHECWDKMSEPGSHLWPFIQGCEVSNFPKHEDCARHIRLAKVAKILRIVAIQESMWLKTIKLVVAGQADNVLNIPTAPGSSRSSIPDVPANEGALTRNLEDSVTHDLASPGSVGVEPGSMKLDDNLVSRRSSAIITRESSGDKSGSDQDNVTRGSSKVGLESTSPLPTPEEDQEETDVITPEMQENGPVENLLYHSFDLISSKKKRMQRLLLHILLVEIRDRFNLKLEETRSSKRDIMERIKEMNARIRELQRLLGQKDEFTLPIFDHIENPNSIFEVKDEEIAFPKPVTEEDRLEELRRLEEENLRIQQGGNGPERALQDMMGGKLEQKEEEVVIETQLEKPTWMSGNPKNFTKEQLKEIKEFEGKIKAQKEEKEKKVRAQEAEQRKLKSDIQDLMTMFDKSVMDLYNMRLMEEVECNEIEEKIARLSNEIEEEEALDEQKEEDLAKRLELLKVAKGRSVSTLTEFKREVDDFREHYDEAIAEDKALDRNFKKDFADCGDLVALLYKHFRRRRPSTPNQEANKFYLEKDATSLVHYVRTLIKITQGRQSILMAKLSSPLDPYNERPEDIEADTWDRLVAARNRKILKEEEVKKKGKILSGMLSYLSKLTASDDANRKRFEKALRTLAEFREGRDKKKKNLAFLLHVKQGLVEIELQPLEGDYLDAVLLPRNIVLEFNDIILREANSKIDILVAIKDFKKNIYEVQWENERLQILERNLAEKIRLIQLLRNTRALQVVIKNGEDFSNASESVAIENRMEHNEKLHEKRLLEKICHLQQLEERARKIKIYCSELQKDVANLHQEYTFQQQVCQKSLGHESKDAALKERMLTLFTKRKLREQAKKQAEHIVQLQQELSTTMLKTRPCF